MADKNRLVIITSVVSERMKYIAETIFQERLGVNYLLTDKEQEINSKDCVIEYNLQRHTKYDFIRANSFILETTISKNFKPEVKGEQENLMLFPAPDGIFEMDIFSAIFYCLSHYDAYTSNEKDQHGRVLFKKWFPRTSGLDTLPYVEIWLSKLTSYLESRGLACQKEEFELNITFDIDHFFLIDQRTIWQHIRGSIGDLIRLDFFYLLKRWLIILGLTEDPAERFFDLLDYQGYKKLTFFILMKQGRNNSLNPLNDLKKLLIKRLKKYGEVGLHPSYYCMDKPNLVQEEKEQLTQIVEQPITDVRYHFLRVKFPEAFYTLVKNGIQKDQTIGYYDQPGFLSSTCRSYYFFDPEKNQKLNLIIEPFVWMDSMNRYYRKIDEREERTELHHLKEIVRKYNGKFSVVFHNDSMVDRKYRMLFKSLLFN